MKDSDTDFVARCKMLYKGIGQVRCTALSGRLIHFTDDGYRHLVWKNGKKRLNAEIIDRFSLLPKAARILATRSVVYEYREHIRSNSIARFWSISGKGCDRSVKIVVRQINDGRLHFFSIMRL